ncbi:MAG: formylglycine-generating enzyme family protein [Anaerolineae bacterium]|jgi:formylglycine-generating enzyme required for sulfatase activity|nr:formylglycine-generating enzyme family protein [Anaerolineae bacterium]
MAEAMFQCSETVAQTLQFATVTVDADGSVIRTETCHAERFVETLRDGVALEMIAIPGGAFQMGSRASEGYPDEQPQHSARLQPFWMARYPVTQRQWQAVLGSLPRCRTVGPEHPVDRVSWHDAVAFCRRLAQHTGRAYRLPGETEWEYACRAGSATPFCFGPTITTDLANYVGEHTYLGEPKGIYRHGSSEVGSFPPNAFGLCDMHGNVWEWCADAWHDDHVGAPADGSIWERGATGARVLRGGCWHDPPNLCRSAARLRQAPDQGEDFFGCRVALSSIERHQAGQPTWLGRIVRRWSTKPTG